MFLIDDDKKVPGTTEFLDLLSTYLQAATKAIIGFAPKVWEATLALIQFHAIFVLIAGFVVTTVCGVVAYKLLKHVVTHWDDLEEGEIAPRMVIGIPLALVAGGVFCGVFLDYDHWLGAFAPQLEIVSKIAQKAGLL